MIPKSGGTQRQQASVMAGLVPAIHDLFLCKDVDARHKAGHDNEKDHASEKCQGRNPIQPEAIVL
jgi:hypothetical protein